MNLVDFDMDKKMSDMDWKGMDIGHMKNLMGIDDSAMPTWFMEAEANKKVPVIPHRAHRCERAKEMTTFLHEFHNSGQKDHWTHDALELFEDVFGMDGATATTNFGAALVAAVALFSF